MCQFTIHGYYRLMCFRCRTRCSTGWYVLRTSNHHVHEHKLNKTGRADALEETPLQTSRREAREEIGLPETNASLPSPFTVEHLCELPANLAWTELVVRPCVALLHSYDEKTGVNEDPEVSLIPRLDAREVAAVFTAPFHNFLKQEDEFLPSSDGEAVEAGSASPGEWYSGVWTEWHQSNWRSKFVICHLCFHMTSCNGSAFVAFHLILNPYHTSGPANTNPVHQFFVPVRDKSVTKPKPRNQAPTQKHAVDKLSQDEHEREKAGQSTTRFRVHGMTARMLVDAARVAYAEEPEFEHNSDFGDEEMITRLMRMGRLSAVRKKGDKLTKEDMQRAAKLS